MKLTESRTKSRMREELIRSNLLLRNGSYERLANVLGSGGVNVAEAYVINCIPEQAEDIYAVLVSGGEVVMVEVPRGEGQALMNRESLLEYKSKCSKVQRQKIALALELLAPGVSRTPHN